jgi:hypothetical protein
MKTLRRSPRSRCPRWRTPCEAGSDTAPARSGSSGHLGGGGLRGPSPGSMRPPCRGRGPVRRWPEPAPGRPHHLAPPAGSRRRGLAAPGWRRPRLGRSRPATPGPACPPSGWLAPGRGGRSRPSGGLRPAPRRRSIAAIESATRCRRRGRSHVFPRQAAKPVDRHWIAISKLLVAPSMAAHPQPLLPSPARYTVSVAPTDITVAITDEASPFALPSTRNRPRRAMRRLPLGLRNDCETAHGSVMIRAVIGGSGRDSWND